MWSILIGFLSSGLPHVFEYFKAKQDNAHELAMFQMQIEASKAEAQSKLEATMYESAASIEVAEQERFSTEKPVQSGIRWIDGLNASVRPIVTYWILAIYTISKVWIFFPITLLPWQTSTLWLAADADILGAVIAYHFGSRSFSKLRGK